MIQRQSGDQALALPHVIEYNHLDPSPRFTKEQIAFIESIRKDFCLEDLDRIRKLEWFALNTNWELMGEPARFGYGAIPGLRHKLGQDSIYVKRFSSGKYQPMMDDFLSDVPHGFPEADLGRCNMPGYRLTLPNGDRYYPLAFHGDLEQWRKRLRESADRHETLLGRFDQGQFALSDGRRFPFSALTLDRLESKAYPNDW